MVSREILRMSRILELAQGDEDDSDDTDNELEQEGNNERKNKSNIKTIK